MAVFPGPFRASGSAPPSGDSTGPPGAEAGSTVPPEVCGFRCSGRRMLCVCSDLIVPWCVGWLCAGRGGGLVLGVCGALPSEMSEAGRCGGSRFVTRMWCWWECSLVLGVALVGVVGWAARGGACGGPCWRCACVCWGCRRARAAVVRMLGAR